MLIKFLPSASMVHRSRERKDQEQARKKVAGLFTIEYFRPLPPPSPPTPSSC